MWQFTRRLSLTRRSMSIRFSRYTVQLDPDGVVVSEVNDELEAQFRKNPAFKYIETKPQPEPVAVEPEAEVEVESVKDEPECDIMEKPKSSRKRPSSRSRRKPASSKRD